MERGDCIILARMGWVRELVDKCMMKWAGLDDDLFCFGLLSLLMRIHMFFMVGTNSKKSV